MSEETKNLNLENLVSELEKILGGGKITFANIIIVCLEAMKIVERYPNLKGSDKKELVIHALEVVMTKTESDSTLVSFLASFIDSVIDIEKGNIKIKIKPEKIGNSCLGLCKCKKKT